MCLILIPVTVLYATNFKLILNLKNEVDRNTDKAIGLAELSEQEHKDRKEQAERQEAQMNELLSVENIKNVLRVVGVPVYNMSLVDSCDRGLLPRVCLHDELRRKSEPSIAERRRLSAQERLRPLEH